MIGRIKGILLEKEPSLILVEVNGIGYEILVPISVISEIGNIGKEVILYTHLSSREDIQQLYGFITKLDRWLFQKLIKINGIGSKMALTILSSIDCNTFIKYIELKDYAFLCKVPGIGKKTAERIIIEIRDKVNKIPFNVNMTKKCIDTLPSSNENSVVNQAIKALETLGYKQQEAVKCIHKVSKKSDSVENTIKLALQYFQKIK